MHHIESRKVMFGFTAAAVLILAMAGNFAQASDVVSPLTVNGTTSTSACNWPALEIMNFTSGQAVVKDIPLNVYAPLADKVDFSMRSGTSVLASITLPNGQLTATNVWTSHLDSGKFPNGPYLLDYKATYSKISTTVSQCSTTKTVSLVIQNSAAVTSGTSNSGPSTTATTQVVPTPTPTPTVTTEKLTTISTSGTSTPTPSASPTPTSSTSGKTPLATATPKTSGETSGSTSTAKSELPAGIVTTPTPTPYTVSQQEVVHSLSLGIENVTQSTVDVPKVTPSTSTNPTPAPVLPTHTSQKALRFFGTALPNSEVEIEIHSDPIVIKVLADSQGNWSYTLKDPLDSGKHEVKVSVVDPVSQQRVSKSSSFFIGQAVAASSLNGGAITGKGLILEDPQVLLLQNYLGAALAIVAVAIACLYAIYRLKLKTAPSFAS